MSTGYTGMNHAGYGTLTDIDHLNQSITDIILTPEGSRVMRREYGSNLPALLDSPANEITRLRCMSAAVIAITRWEPRVAINSVDLTWRNNGSAVLSMSYLIVSTMQSASISVDIQGGRMPTIDLSQLPQPAIIESLDYEVILAQTKTFMISVFPEAMRDEVAAALELESEPLNIIAQAMAWRELLLRQRINDGAAACMLSHSSGSDLDNLGVNMNVQRPVITEATETTPAVMESDAAFGCAYRAPLKG